MSIKRKSLQYNGRIIMKKLFALLLVFAMIFATLPFTAFASEATSMQSQLTIKACNAFPEYANKIRAQEQQIAHNQLSVLSNQSKDVIINETRDISDTESITYTEFSNGVIMLTGSSVSYDVESDNTSTSGSNVNHTVDIYAELVGYPNCHVNLYDIKYTIVKNGYDKITSKGTSVKGSKCTGCSVAIYPSTESSSSKAKLTADIYFQYGSGSAGNFCWTQLVMSVGGDSRSISYNNLDWGY